MDPLNEEEEDIEKETRNVIKRLADKEKENKTLFRNWPKFQWTSYELEPKRRNSDLEGAATKS